MAGIVVLAVAGMTTSLFIARINQGMAAAVNQSGTLRMQSYRIASALAQAAQDATGNPPEACALADEFERRLGSARLIDSVPKAEDDPVYRAYQRVHGRWSGQMRRAVDDSCRGAHDAALRYLLHVDDFVDDVHLLVHVLEERAERRTRWLQGIQITALGLTMGLVLVALAIVRKRVVQPLNALLHSAEKVRRGDFSGHVEHEGKDELGRLGAAMNLMTEGLHEIYAELEQRIAEKSRDLARTNHSLELLYRTSRTLDEAPISETVLRKVLGDVRDQLKLDALTLCLRTDHSENGQGCIRVGDEPMRIAGPGWSDCAACRDPLADEVPAESEGTERIADSKQTLTFAVSDQERRYGSLLIRLPPYARLESWQRPLLESVIGHLTAALQLQEGLRENRRLVLYEERSILARELHDSLAQSLSYLKIQAARLDMALSDKTPRTSADETGEAQRTPKATVPLDADAILLDMREGISSAYRQLRELLTTFRLKIDGHGLTSALHATVEEFRRHSDLVIELDGELREGVLSPNEEVHVLQIVREALSNAVQHARATTCTVSVALHAGEVSVRVEDDGSGLPSPMSPRGHHGLTIMRERAATLGGRIEIDSSPQGRPGTLVHLRFTPRLSRSLPPREDNKTQTCQPPQSTSADRPNEVHPQS